MATTWLVPSLKSYHSACKPRSSSFAAPCGTPRGFNSVVPAVVVVVGLGVVGGGATVVVSSGGAGRSIFAVVVAVDIVSSVFAVVVAVDIIRG
jgi:hypothetical protein